MFVVNLLWYRDVDAGDAPTESLGEKIANLLRVLRNAKFMIFLLIFSLYWIMFWQIFVVIPFYITDFISPDAPFEIVMSVGAWSIIVLQLAVNRLTKRLPTKSAIVAGFAVSSLCWLVISLHPTVWTIVAGIVVWSLGEMTQAPRYYEYVSDLAPKGQQALFQGYAFLPIAIAWFIGGTLGGWLYTTYAKEAHNPAMVWYALFAIGVAATGLMWLYNLIVSAREARTMRQ
jgi:MFS family permease